MLSLKRFKKILLWFFLSLLFLIGAAYIFLQTPWGQKWIGGIITKRLSRELHTRVSVKHVDFSLLNRMHLEGLMVEDQKGDTLLYAGDLKVRITDWFIFKKNVELKYIGLDNALVKFQRTDSVWSQQFLMDFFSSPSSGSKKKGGMQMNLKKVEMHNVSFLKKDGWDGNDMTVRLASLNLDADEINFSKKTADIKILTVSKPFVLIYNYTGNNPVMISANPLTADSLSQWNPAGWAMHIGILKIEDGIFKNDKQSPKPLLAGFDGRHIEFANANAVLTDVRWNKDTISSHLEISTKERSGLDVKKLLADAKFTPKEMAFSNLDITTNKSHIHHYFRMSYDDMKSMKDFIHAVNMQGNFDGSEIDSDDIAFFAPSLKTWKKKFIVTGKVRGTVDALTGREMLVKAGTNTLLDGDISLTGLPDIYTTFIDLRANDFRTTYGDAVTIIPAMRRVTNPDLRKIQYVNFKGNFTGFIRDFVTFGSIQTNLGTLVTDINMKLPPGHEPVYSGSFSTDNFRLGEFLDNKTLGAVSVSATVKGTGFSDNTRNTMVDGTVRFIDYDKYRYQNIAIKGRFDKKLFEGLASMRDDNADLDMNGKIDFNKKPLFVLKADVTHSNLKKLGFTKDNITFKGKLDFNFSSDNIDNFLGTAKVSNAELLKDGALMPLDSLTIAAWYDDSGAKNLFATSNEFDAKVSGSFKINELPRAFSFLLNKYYPAYIKAPEILPRDQSISFSINTQYADELLHLVDSNLSGFNFSHIEGNLDLAKNELNLTAKVPQFKYRQFNFDSVNISANGASDRLVLKGNAHNIIINDSLNIPMVLFAVDARNDSSKISIISGVNRKVDTANLNALLLTYKDGVKIEFDPSTFTINSKTWGIDENGVLEFRQNNPARGELTLRESDQKILIKTQPSSKGNWNDVKIELTKVNLGDFSPFFLPQNRLEGLISGSILAEDPTGDLKVSSNDISTQFLRLDNDSLGEVKASLNYDKLTKELTFKGNTVNQENYLGFDGHIFIGDKVKARENNIALKAKNFQIKVLERFLGSLFSDMRGYLTGDIDLDGDFKNLAISGKGRLKDAGLKVNFTQCFYKINDTMVELSPQEINLDGLVLTDTVTRNPIYINGAIEHESFKNMFYDIYITTRKPNTKGNENNRPVQLLNTTFKDNKQFYGNVKGTGSLTLAGPQSDMVMIIDAFASAKDSSYITIPPSSSRESGIADFLVERKFGREMSDSAVNRNLTNITYDVNLTVDPAAAQMVNMKVVLDELTGDEIKGKGAGTLKIISGTSEALSLRGRFDIYEGNYLFTFQSFFKKPFELKKGTDNYIEWSGDPYDAKVNLTATYTANNVSYTPLANAFKNIDQKIANARGDVNVMAKLTDRLFNPKINFSLDFPPSSPVNDDPTLSFSLQQLQKNDNEMNKQATFLVVFGAFAPVENTSGSSPVPELVTSSVSGIFFNEVNKQVQKIVSEIFKTQNLNFNFSSSVYNRNVVDPQSKFNLGSNVNASVGVLINKRVIFSLGGSVEGLLQTGSIQQDVQLLPNFSVELLLNQSGTFRANLFYKQNLDYLTTSTSGPGRMNRTGAGLSYRREADTIWELIFGKKKKKADTPPTPQKEEVKKEDEPKKE
ncbi:MAG: hypothetical protein HZB42_12915 [Sphingobacteriales bacterium]|nr:hypothetical protein [Sphingobacteriales bacterium]